MIFRKYKYIFEKDTLFMTINFEQIESWIVKLINMQIVIAIIIIVIIIIVTITIVVID